MLNKLWNDEVGAILSAELVLVLTIAVMAMIVGLSEVAVSVNQELDDVSNAVGNLDQSYGYSQFAARGAQHGVKSFFAGSSWNDQQDSCDDCDGASDIVCSGIGRGEH